MALSGSQITGIGPIGFIIPSYAGFTAKAESAVIVPSIWSTVATNAATWYVQNPDETTWDSDSTFWDLNGNVYNTLWDNIDNTWAAASTNSTTWTEQ